MKNVKLILSIKIVILSLILSFGFYNVYIKSNYIIFTTAFLVALILLKSIFDQIDQTNKNLTRFLQSIKFSDLSLSFTSNKMGKSFDELNHAFNEVLEEFKKTRGEREENNRYLQTVLRHVGIGLIAFDSNGKIEFINRAARKLLGVQKITHLNISVQLNEQLSRELLRLKSGEKTTVKTVGENDIVQLVVYATEFKMRDSLFKLVSIQNIQSELEEKELEAWQKLIRVLTHEIMNSVTPISSLSATVNDILSDGGADHLDDEQIDDIKNAVNTIHRRSEGLINFVENYRSLTKIPKPNFEIFAVRSLFDRVKNLLEGDLSKFEIELKCNVAPETLELTADPSMIEQVLINLIINSTHALKDVEAKKITLSAVLNEKGRVVIKVTDNGPGIPEDIQEKIFIPFFSTKSSGSGIGLSLARQIMRSHRGNIRVTSKPFEETSLVLIF
jgi:nitrogen fixation/metabolism regulation signal transduction histidine kinase